MVELLRALIFIYTLIHSILSPLCLVLVRAPHQACDTSQILVAGVPDGFSRESPVFFLFIYLFFYFFFFGHTFVCNESRKGNNKTITDTKYTLQAMVCTERQTLHRMHCAFNEMIFMLNN